MIDVMRLLLLITGGLQAVTMVVDEGIFHRQRGLRKFERIGHVADTCFFLVTLCIPASLAPSSLSITSFIVLAFGSCFFITKDEWIHAAACGPFEQWCHSILFVLHSAVLTFAGMVWTLAPQSWELKVLPAIVLAWGLYQHLYWNVYYVGSRD